MALAALGDDIIGLVVLASLNKHLTWPEGKVFIFLTFLRVLPYQHTLTTSSDTSNSEAERDQLYLNSPTNNIQDDRQANLHPSVLRRPGMLTVIRLIKVPVLTSQYRQLASPNPLSDL